MNEREKALLTELHDAWGYMGVARDDEVQNKASYEETGGFRLRTLYSQKVVRN